VTVKGCSFHVAPATDSLTFAGGSGKVSVTTGGACEWTAASHASWIQVAHHLSETGNATITYTIARNPSTAHRTGTLTVAGHTVTVVQGGEPCVGTRCAGATKP
jgi:hypothetical protein